jgi:cytochrome c peroxidase
METREAGGAPPAQKEAKPASTPMTTAEPGGSAAMDAGSRLDGKTGLEPNDPYPSVKYSFDNIYTYTKAALGKVLFWEEQMSSKNNMACGTCHRPGAGGSDPRASDPLSLGAGPNGIFGDADDVHGGRGVARCSSSGAAKNDPVYGSKPQVTTRKPPSYLDAMFFTELFWDGHAGSELDDPLTKMVILSESGALENQATFSPVSDVDMGCEGYDWNALCSKLQAAPPLKLAKSLPPDLVDALASHKTYADLFDWAFGSPMVNPTNIALAIATYERTLTSNQTPWDKFNGGDKTALTSAQQHGLALFNTKARCNHCHVPPLFTDAGYHNIGAGDPNLDKGRWLVTKNDADLGKMKTPSLRNVGLRQAGGLLHSGAATGKSMGTLIATYNAGGMVKDHLDGEIVPLQLTDDEVKDLVDFVENGLTDPRVKAETAPFDRPKLSTE